MFTSFDIKVVNCIESSNKVFILAKNVEFEYIEIDLFCVNVNKSIFDEYLF